MTITNPQGAQIDMQDALRWKRYKIMERMGWTYQEYESSPSWLIEEVWAFMRTESAARETNRG